MKMKSLLLIAVATLGLTTASMAQVPNYVPTNGLVGWWPFNGNANDESGNGNNGINANAVLTPNRFGNSNSAFDFDGNSRIENNNNELRQLVDGTNPFTVTVWFNREASGNTGGAASTQAKALWAFDGNNAYPYKRVWATIGQLNDSTTQIQFTRANTITGAPEVTYNTNTFVQPNTWHFLAITFNGNSAMVFLDNVLLTSVFGGDPVMPISILGPDNDIIGFTIGDNNQNNLSNFSGNLDDIGIWNRALNPQEITDLYNSVNCTNTTAITPQTNSLTTGSTATFTASTSDPNPSYVWQSNFGQGFQTLNNIGKYSGTNTGTLNIANVQLPNHTQPIRVISTSGNCIDTSNVAVINILDTCITSVTVYDTLLTTVTDTLVINATLTGLNPPVNQNTLKVFPNPANTHITIDYGNVSLMSGYTLKIVNALGAMVFSAPINQQTSYINLSTWTGNGIYYVQLINPQNNTIENRKIVIQ
jgi:hypothetical protein